MSTSIEVRAITTERDNIEHITDEAKLLSGKAAGVCYMPNDYLDNGIQDADKAVSRANDTASRGHTSVFGHTAVTMTIKTSKMMCMLLNSIGVYNTSEKSARYTKMQPKTELEAQVYEKWLTKIKGFILEDYPDIDDEMLSKRLCKKMGIEYDPETVVNGSFSHIKDDEYVEEELNKLKESETLPSYKLAQENARYMISVFTPTAMMYTIPYRELVFVSNHLALLIECCKINETEFNKQLEEDALALLHEIDKVLEEKPFRDNKNEYFRFMLAQHLGEMRNGKFVEYNDDEVRRLHSPKKESIADSYTLTYNGSLAMLAQAQRHRTLRYTMNFDGSGNIKYYVPDIIRIHNCVDEWLMDLESVSYCTPQATLVEITEQGIFEDFVLKCKERMCGRAQHEIMKNTTESVNKFIHGYKNLSQGNIFLLKGITVQEDNGTLTPCARCMYRDFSCSEGCHWGAKKALERHI